MDENGRSDMWPARHARSYKKWFDVVRLTKAGNLFSDERGFSELCVWGKCGYCDEFMDPYSSFLIDRCKSCPLNQRSALLDGMILPICHSCPNTDPSIAYEYVREMRSGFFAEKKRALALAKIVLDEIAKDKPK